MPKPTTDVFINIPFDDQHESLYLSLIAAIVGMGLQPRCVLEVPRDQTRLDRIHKLIAACPFSIHDLSAVKLSSSGPFRVPRFNMPFELGLAVAISLATKERHKFRMMDAIPHRVAQSLSDVNGYDPFVHYNSQEGVYEAVSDMFADLPAPPVTDVRTFRKVRRALSTYRHQELQGDVFRPRPYGRLVTTARALVLEVT
jgi:hypothetical protein